MTTLVRSVSQTYEYEEQGTGFFFDEVTDQLIGSEMKECDWLLNGQWLITNRHVVFPHETVPDYLEFNLRKRFVDPQTGKTVTNWHPVRLNSADLLKRTRVHRNPAVDVAAIDIQDKLIDVYGPSTKRFNNVDRALTLNADFLPARFPMRIEATSDVVVCSYPCEFYDKTNKFPIIKSGIIASMWGQEFEDLPCFLIDAQLFKGSSGGLVLTKPSDMVTMEGEMPRSMQGLSKWFVLLGIFGEYYSVPEETEDGKIYDQNMGLGVVWYSYLIPDIIKNGVRK